MSEDFVYKGRSASSIRKREQADSGYDRWYNNKYPTYKPKEGKNRVRILPPGWVKNPKKEKKWGDMWDAQVFLHRNIGPDNATFLCLAKMKGEECSLCDTRAELLAEEGDDPKYDRKDKEGKRKKRPSDLLRAQSASICLIIDRKGEEEAPMVWTAPGTIVKEINNRSKEEDGAAILVDHPDEGYDISFTREGTGLTTKYTGVNIAREPTALSESAKQQRRWLRTIEETALPDILIYHDNDYMEKVYMGKKVKNRDEDEELDRDEDEDEDEEDTKSKKNKKKSKAKDDDEDDDDDEETAEDDDDDDDDVKPKKKKKKPVDEDEDEDEEDEKPKKKKKKSKDEDGDMQDDEVDEDDENEDEKPKKKKGKSKSKDEDEDEEDEEKEDEEEDADEDEKPKKKGSKVAKKVISKLKKKKKKDEDEDDDD